MYMEPDDLESWRIFFSTSGVNIFVIINKAIMVAAKDYPSHLKLRRDQIVSLLYSHCSPCNQPELSIPLEGTTVFQPNVEAYCRNCFQVDEHGDKNRRIDHVDFNLSMEPIKNLMAECNGEKKTSEPTNVIHGIDKEAAASEHEDRSQQVEHQDQTFLLTLENAAVEPCGDTLSSDGVFKRKEIDSLDNENFTILGSSDLENMGFNGITNDKDVDLLVGLNKTVADQTVKFRKKVSFSVTADGKSVELCQVLYKNPTERSHSAVEGEPTLSQMGGSPSEQTEGMTDLTNAGDETCEEVLKAKRILEDWKNQSDMMLLDLLVKLRSLKLNFDILKVTLIGKSVRALQKHVSKEIRDAARSLIRYWKAKVDEWVHANVAVEEGQSPSGILNEGDSVAPTCDTLTEFFSTLSPENIQGTLYFNKELSFPEEELLQICTDPGRIGIIENTREEDLQHTLPLLKASSFSENKQSPTDKNEHKRFDNAKISKEEHSKTKNVRISRSIELQKVEETRRNEQDGYNNGKDVKKRCAMKPFDVNHHHPHQELKRHKHHLTMSRIHGEFKGAKQST